MALEVCSLCDLIRAYLLLCLFLRKRFLRLCVDILCLFFFFPLGIAKMIYKWIKNLFLHALHEYLGRLESGDVVSRNDESRVL